MKAIAAVVELWVDEKGNTWAELAVPEGGSADPALADFARALLGGAAQLGARSAPQDGGAPSRWKAAARK